MAGKKDPSLSPRYTNGPVVKTGPTAGQNRSRNDDGSWRKKRDDAGKSRDNGKKGCFITTAACSLQCLPDDCYELTTLRAFRDDHLLRTSSGRALVEHYYEIAPALAAQLVDSPQLGQVWKTIQNVVVALEHKNYNAATDLYRAMVVDLERKLG